MDAPLQLALPFSLQEAVSVTRASKILGVNTSTVYRLIRGGSLQYIRRGSRGLFFVRWKSLVDYCDELMKLYEIPDRRPILTDPRFRYSDRDVLPFPLDQSMSVDEVMRVLQLEKTRVIDMANFGDLDAYHLVENSPWRFYRPSVEKFVSDVHLRSAVRRRLVRGS